MLSVTPFYAFGWSQHHQLTRHALSKIEKYSNTKVVIEDIGPLLKSLGLSDERSLAESLTIHKNFKFEFKAGEKVGQKIALIDVLSTYSDEPDWRMDQHLFDEDQYPQIWDKAYKFMGGKQGIPSQAFRHMYWAPFNWSYPLESLRLPLQNMFSPMGHAPERADVFVQLARKAAAHGHKYWAVRFLGNGLHYLEDVSSPFHSTQTPSKHFVSMPFTEPAGRGFKDYVKQVTHVVSYFHFSFEGYIGEVMTNPNLAPEANREFAAALSGTSASGLNDNVGDSIRKMQLSSMSNSSDAARSSIAFFPPLTESFDTVEPLKFMNEDWWKQTLERGEKSSEPKTQYFKTVREMFSRFGDAVRSYCERELAVLSPPLWADASRE